MGKKLRNYLIAGIVALIPLTITYIALRFLFHSFDSLLRPLFIRILTLIGVPIDHDSPIIFGIGLLVTILAVFLTGIMTKNYFGHKFMQAGEWTLKRIPLVNSIYFASKQLVGAFALPGKKAFHAVVMIEYPRRGLFSLGFITTDTPHYYHDGQEPLHSIFVPTTPNPTSGVLVLAGKEEFTILPLSVEEGIKFIVSGGILTPRSYEQHHKQATS